MEDRGQTQVCGDCVAGTCQIHTGGRPFQPAGPPPGPVRTGRTRLPAWAIVVIVVTAVLAVCCLGVSVLGVLSADDSEDSGAPAVAATETATGAPEAPQTRPPEVEVTGDCEKKIIGYYGLIASVTVDNPTDQEVTGVVWVSWEVLGNDPYVFREEMAIEPGDSTTLHVDEEIESDQWYQVDRGCDYGWDPAG